MTPELPPPSAAPELRLMNDARRIRDTGLAILVWVDAFVAVPAGLAQIAALVLISPLAPIVAYPLTTLFWGLAHIAGAVLMFALGAIIAYALTPLVGRLTRVMPRWLALIIVYIGLLVVIAAAIFLLVVAVFQEFGPLVDQINKWLQSQGGNGAAAITDYLKQLGLTQDQIDSLTNDLARSGG